MKCPKCASTMEQVVYEGIEVDRCTTCKGLWFDIGEKEALSGTKAAANIDVGDASEGAEMSDIDRYPCPSCNGVMLRMVDPQQSHIWYEKCSSCGGSFFDAGEFRDLSENTISDFFKDLFTPERK
jgi:Zn-finger nucleic acid-binding protein